MKRILIVAALLAAFFGLCAAWPTQAQQSGAVEPAQGSRYLVQQTASRSTLARAPVKANSPAPAFTVKTLQGNNLRLSDFQGKVVLLDFGAVDCPPCRVEMPILQRWHKQYQRRGLAVLGLLEMNPTVHQARKMLQERHLSYPVAIDPGEEIGKRYGLIAHPTTVVIDRAGKVVKAETGFVKGDEKGIEGAFLPLLAPGAKGTARP